MAAPGGGYGPYSVGEIVQVLITAYTGFRAAVLESERGGGAECPAIVHTGFWGCGAFGGNRVLMAMLQVMAAEMAGIERMVFHTGADGAHALATAQAVIDEVLADGSPEDLRERIERIASLGFEWGQSDGN